MGLFFSRMRRDPLFCVLAALLLLWIAAMFAVPPFLPYDAYTNDMGARLLPVRSVQPQPRAGLCRQGGGGGGRRLARTL